MTTTSHFDVPPIQVFTYGNWHTETASKAALDKIIQRSGLFRIYPEVRGCYLQPRYDQVGGPGGVRIDRILMPTQELLDEGWVHGPIGVECKTSGVKVGPVMAQALDYLRSAWEIRTGYRFLLSWVFIWPLLKQTNFVGSVMAQNRIGAAWAKQYPDPSWDVLCLYSGEVSVLRWDATRGITSLGDSSHKLGRRVGTR